MRLQWIVVTGALLLAAPVMAQHAHGHSRASAKFAARSPSAASGFGSILFPGTGGPPPLGTNSTFPQRLSSTISGFHGNLHVGHAGLGRNLTGHPRSAPRSFQRRAVPVVGYIPYYAGYNYAPPQPQQVHVTVQSAPAPQQPVIINQYYQAPAPNPEMREYPEGSLPETPSSGMKRYQAPIPSHPTPEARIENAEAAQPQATIYLIAYEDHSIYPAVGYWVEDGTLHYITTQGSHNKASLELIDVEFSHTLNAERGIVLDLEAH